jgi:hypothetical protein
VFNKKIKTRKFGGLFQTVPVNILEECRFTYSGANREALEGQNDNKRVQGVSVILVIAYEVKEINELISE